MSNYVSNILSGSELNMDTLKSALESYLPSPYINNYQSGLTSMASSTPAALESPGLSITSVSDDELLVFLFQHCVSGGTVNDVIGTRSFLNTDDMGNYSFSKAAVAATAGDAFTETTIAVGQNYSGTVSAYSKWWRNVGSGTIYSQHRNYYCFRLKKRA